MNSERRPMIITVEGNIGAGKTTFLEYLEKQLCNAGITRIRVLREPVDIWNTIQDSAGENILTKFYHDPVKYAFPFQVMAFSTRLGELRRVIREHPECEVLVCERSLDADREIFAKMLRDDGIIEDVCFQIYEKFYRESATEFTLDAVMYLSASPELCAERVVKRGREGEGGITIDYLKKCGDYHDRWLGGDDVKCPLIRIESNKEGEYQILNSLELFPVEFQTLFAATNK